RGKGRWRTRGNRRGGLAGGQGNGRVMAIVGCASGSVGGGERFGDGRPSPRSRGRRRPGVRRCTTGRRFPVFQISFRVVSTSCCQGEGLIPHVSDSCPPRPSGRKRTFPAQVVAWLGLEKVRFRTPWDTLRKGQGNKSPRFGIRPAGPTACGASASRRR